MLSGSVMTPTMPRMAYLTLRGIAVARIVGLAFPTTRVVEVHPSAAMVLRGAPLDAVKAMKKDPEARAVLVAWLTEQGLDALRQGDPSDHEVAAYACALAAWKWALGEPVWCTPADPPLHPFDFAC